MTITIGERNRAADTVEQKLLYTTEKSKFQAVRDLVAEGLKPPVLIFVQSKVRAKELFEELVRLSIFLPNFDVLESPSLVKSQNLTCSLVHYKLKN